MRKAFRSSSPDQYDDSIRSWRYPLLTGLRARHGRFLRIHEAAICHFYAHQSLLTLHYLKFNATAYKGPALVISAEYNFILCGGYYPGELEASFVPLFSGAKHFKTYIQPLSGHGLNVVTNTIGAYEVIFEYLAKNGL